MSTFKTSSFFVPWQFVPEKKTSSDWKWSTTLVGRIYPSTIWRLHHSSQFIRIPLTLGHEFRWMQAPTPKNLQLPRRRLEVTIVIAGWGSSINLHLNHLTMVPQDSFTDTALMFHDFRELGAICWTSKTRANLTTGIGSKSDITWGVNFEDTDKKNRAIPCPNPEDWVALARGLRNAFQGIPAGLMEWMCLANDTCCSTSCKEDKSWLSIEVATFWLDRWTIQPSYTKNI